MSSFAPEPAMMVCRAMRGDDDLIGGGAAGVFELPLLYAEAVEILLHHRVMNELTKYGGRSAGSCGVGGTEGIADAKAHAVMGSEVEFHNGWMDEWGGGWSVSKGD